ncbi:MAG TPA: chemotaxis protein CheX [Bryobacteraceae bacterium]|nr:chemotaxis protein CheX [Bryobacteraceae bacterium]
MKLEELIVTGIRHATTEVFSTMLGVELESAEVSIEAGEPEANDGVVSLIGLAGPWVGTGSVTCSPEVACRVCSQMLMTEASAVNEEVLDAVAELTNMIIGGVKNGLEPELGALCLSIPTVVFGKNFRTKSAGTAEWIVLRFPWDGDKLVVKMCLAQAEKIHPILHAPTHTCALEI